MSTWNLTVKRTLTLKRQKSVLLPFSKTAFFVCLLCFNLLLPQTLGELVKMARKIKTDTTASGTEARSIVPVLVSLI